MTLWSNFSSWCEFSLYLILLLCVVGSVCLMIFFLYLKFSEAKIVCFFIIVHKICLYEFLCNRKICITNEIKKRIIPILVWEQLSMNIHFYFYLILIILVEKFWFCNTFVTVRSDELKEIFLIINIQCFFFIIFNCSEALFLWIIKPCAINKKKMSSVNHPEMVATGRN